ncbi:MAG TPA: FGGY family carbohydrate kinase [Acidimicrobiales bacterium]|nr:FGGY family carbohydrate kinase [Acidimicrobiales bacterium]
MTRPAASVLVVDVGTSGVRAGVVRPDATVEHVHYVATPARSPADGLVEVDAELVARAVLDVAGAALAAEGGPVGAVGIANQRATTVVWERSTGRPVGPGIGWQDLRTVGTCLAMQAEGHRFLPNASATKLAAVLDQVDPDRSRARELCFGTVDTWVAWTLSGGAGGQALHVTDATNAAVTQLLDFESLRWDPSVLSSLRIPADMLPAVVDSSGFVGEASALAGSPPIAGLAGDQQASLVGQGCTRPGLAKATFGSGGMLDLCTGLARPATPQRGEAGTFPIVAWRRDGVDTWGREAMMLSAGSCIDWLRDDLGLLATSAESAEVAARSASTGDLWFVPALMGLGAPVWDFGARSLLLGLTRGTGRAEVVRAVLRGIAHRGADLLEAAEADSGLRVGALRVDGGMSANEVFVQELADACGRPVDVSPVTEATTLGAGFLAGIALGTWKDEEDAARAFTPARTVEPVLGDAERRRVRARWLEARDRARRSIPELSAIEF